MKKSGLLIFILLFLVGCSIDLEDEIVTYEYDDYGNMIKELIDSDGDGEFDRILNYEYKSVRGEWELLRIWTDEYDSDGNRIKQSIDSDGDGVIDEINYGRAPIPRDGPRPEEEFLWYN